LNVDNSNQRDADQNKNNGKVFFHAD
jgi:hypothetical protein